MRAQVRTCTAQPYTYIWAWLCLAVRIIFVCCNWARMCRSSAVIPPAESDTPPHEQRRRSRHETRSTLADRMRVCPQRTLNDFVQTTAQDSTRRARFHAQGANTIYIIKYDNFRACVFRWRVRNEMYFSLQMLYTYTIVYYMVHYIWHAGIEGHHYVAGECVTMMMACVEPTKPTRPRPHNPPTIG